MAEKNLSRLDFPTKKSLIVPGHPDLSRGRYLDNIFTERLWRTVKYENVYLHSYASLSEAEAGLADYFDFYNRRRLRQALNYRTPAELYFQG